MDRRDALRSLGLGASAAATGMHGFATEADAEEVRGRVSTRSEPSQLKITDLRVVSVHRRWIVRVDTNQGLHGYGEVRDGGSPTYALMLKSRILGENPCRAALRRRWAELIRRVYEVDPLVCPRCGGEMRVIGFITQPALIDRILDHLRKRDKVSRPPRPPPHSPQPVVSPA